MSLGVCPRSPGPGGALGRLAGGFLAGSRLDFCQRRNSLFVTFFTSYEQPFGVGFAGGIGHLVPDECYQLAGRQWF